MIKAREQEHTRTPQKTSFDRGGRNTEGEAQSHSEPSQPSQSKRKQDAEEIPKKKHKPDHLDEENDADAGEESQRRLPKTVRKAQDKNFN